MINTTFLILISICLIGYFIFRFGMVSRGNLKELIEFSGGLVLFVSFLLVFFLVGWKALLVQIGVFWIIITPIVEILILYIKKYINKPYEYLKKD